MICRQCGIESTENCNFCIKCGARLKITAPVNATMDIDARPTAKNGGMKGRLNALSKKIKVAAVIGLALMMIMILIICTGADSARDFEYLLVDGEVVITGYLGTSRRIHVPSKIEGRPVTQIGEDAFAGYDMVSIILPDSVTIIHDNAFDDCATLESITMDGVETIGTAAFSECDSLSEIVLPESLKRIESMAFIQCRNLREVKLPDGLEFLGYGSFAVCDNLEKLNIPDKFTGFEIENTIIYADFYSRVYGEKIFGPCYNSDTVLVVKAGSEAHMLLIQYGHDEIPFELR